jgi:hypothetical protein
MTSKIFNSWAARTIALLTILGFVYGYIRYVVKAEVSDLNTKVETANTNIARILDNIVRIDGDVKKANERIDTALTDALNKLVLSKGAAIKGSELLEKGQTILAIAKSIDAKLKPDSLAGYGKLVSTLTNSPSLSDVAWRNLTQAVDYRTFLNADYAPKPSDFTPATGREGYKFDLQLFPDRPENNRVPAAVIGTAGGHVPQEQSARLETLTAANPRGSGFGFIVVEGGNQAVVLDGMYMKNVIVRNARIIYNGAPIKFENVYFVNCTFRFPLIEQFHLDRQGPVRNLSHAILEATAVNFSTVAPA